MDRNHRTVQVIDEHRQTPLFHLYQKWHRSRHALVFLPRYRLLYLSKCSQCNMGLTKAIPILHLLDISLPMRLRMATLCQGQCTVRSCSIRCPGRLHRLGPYYLRPKACSFHLLAQCSIQGHQVCHRIRTRHNNSNTTLRCLLSTTRLNTECRLGCHQLVRCHPEGILRRLLQLMALPTTSNHCHTTTGGPRTRCSSSRSIHHLTLISHTQHSRPSQVEDTCCHRFIRILASLCSNSNRSDLSNHPCRCKDNISIRHMDTTPQPLHRGSSRHHQGQSYLASSSQLLPHLRVQRYDRCGKKRIDPRFCKQRWSYHPGRKSSLSVLSSSVQNRPFDPAARLAKTTYLRLRSRPKLRHHRRRGALRDVAMSETEALIVWCLRPLMALCAHERAASLSVPWQACTHHRRIVRLAGTGSRQNHPRLPMCWRMMTQPRRHRPPMRRA